jgi:alkyl sulfatase BDS1-like metallo-beta-lactamase superfamily hydrolase
MLKYTRYTLRGANFHNPSYWSKSIDTFLTHFGDAHHLVLQHGSPIINNEDHSPGMSDPSDTTTHHHRGIIKQIRHKTIKSKSKKGIKNNVYKKCK